MWSLNNISFFTQKNPEGERESKSTPESLISSRSISLTLSISSVLSRQHHHSHHQVKILCSLLHLTPRRKINLNESTKSTFLSLKRHKKTKKLYLYFYSLPFSLSSLYCLRLYKLCASSSFVFLGVGCWNNEKVEDLLRKTNILILKRKFLLRFYLNFRKEKNLFCGCFIV